MEAGTRTLVVLQEANTRLPGCDNIGTAHRTRGRVVAVVELQNCDGELPVEGDDSGVDTEPT